MKTDQKKKTIILVGIFILLIGVLGLSKQLFNKTEELDNKTEILLANNISSKTASLLASDKEISVEEETVTEEVKDEVIVDEIVYDGLTLTQLSDKLNRSLNSTIAGKGELFATYSLGLGLDPYLAVAIVLHETGCTWECSVLVKQCNNVGGQKGSPGCGGGSYQTFNTLDEGITKFMDNLFYNYYNVGLTTPEAINIRYAESKAWAERINSYIEKIKAS